MSQREHDIASDRGGGPERAHYDVVILGAGQAGLSLARHLLLETRRRVLLLERRSQVPPPRQKVGESMVQLAGYYYGEVLDLERYLLREHTLKYNLRFYWPSASRDNRGFEDYSKSFIRELSNIPSYQIDRNRFERDLLRMNSENERFTFQPAVRELEVELVADGPHTLSYRSVGRRESVTADWVVDASGRRRFLAKERQLDRGSVIRHSSFFWWVEGLVDVERLTGRTRRQVRLDPERRATGHFPTWMATNHFAGEGFWLWVIPLHGMTSLGLVYDHTVIPHQEVFSVERATEWVCRRFPLLGRDLPRRKVVDFGGLRDYALDSTAAIDSRRWALTGESGRFSDPLYSPGSDLIALHSTLIVDAIETGDPQQLAVKCELYEPLLRSLYAAYIPSYATSYNALGDQETFSLKYVWELTIYFAFYVFPFINDLFTDRRFLLGYLRRLEALGSLNETVQSVLSGYYRWKQEYRSPPGEPICFDFTEVGPLARAQSTFYDVGVSVEEARRVQERQLANVEELARFILARVATVVAGDRRAMVNRDFVEALDPRRERFDAEAIRRRWQACHGRRAAYPWSFDPTVMERFDAGPVSTVAGAARVAEEEPG